MFSWKNKRVFITGASGLLGSWLTEALVAKGATVVVLVRDWVPESLLLSSATLEHVTVVRGDLVDIDVVERVLNEYEIDTVFHLGAQTIVQTSNRSPLSSFESNIKGTWVLLDACRHLGTVQRIVIASTDKAYGTQPILPYTEEMPLLACHPYDVSKACADMIAQAYYATYKLPLAITRCGNIYGGGDLNFNRIIPGTIRSLYDNERPIIRSDGQYIRDYIYIKDVIAGYILLAENLHRSDVQGQAFNFSTNNRLFVIDVVDTIKIIMQIDREPIIQNTASGEILAQYLSSEKAARVLGWKAQYDLTQGLQETIAWYTTFFHKQQKQEAASDDE
ncbi:MAG: GDP-mannose 4,6-dehydratase [Nanoarchaeota archaeon]